MNLDSLPRVGAVILAAGQSRRMGRSKLSLPWGASTVIERVVEVLTSAGVSPLVVVTGAWRVEIQACLEGRAIAYAHNPDFAAGEMLSSVQVGLQALGDEVEAALLVLGDQPGIEEATVRKLLDAFRQDHPLLLFPSFNQRRGHPWLVERSLWPEILRLQTPATLREFTRSHAADIQHVLVENASILLDLDSPEDYQKQKPPNHTSG
jgi:molybdenum cofactor cytidylyltransferase